MLGGKDVSFLFIHGYLFPSLLVWLEKMQVRKTWVQFQRNDTYPVFVAIDQVD